jgi:ketol-acid reductoisomerase
MVQLVDDKHPDRARLAIRSMTIIGVGSRGHADALNLRAFGQGYRRRRSA